VAVMHHIAVDGWSMRPFARDLEAAYHARLTGELPLWPVLPVQYADFALWQLQALDLAGPAGPAVKDQLDFWAAELAGLPDEIPLPLDRVRPPVRDWQGGLAEFSVDADVHAGLADTGRACQATLFMVLQAAVVALLHRLGAGTDIPLGAPVAGRGDEALDELVGFFVNTLVLRADAAGNPAFSDLVARVRAADLRAWAHQDVPFERVVEETAAMRSAAVHPLFQVMFGVDDEPGEGLTLDRTRSEQLRLPASAAKFDLTITFRPATRPDGTPAGLTGQVSYATDIFDPATITAITRRLTSILTTAAANPHTTINNLEEGA
jgi:condensation domain-containing protein